MSTRTDSGLIRQAVCPYLHRWLFIKSRSQEKLGLGLPAYSQDLSTENDGEANAGKSVSSLPLG